MMEDDVEEKRMCMCAYVCVYREEKGEGALWYLFIRTQISEVVYS